MPKNNCLFPSELAWRLTVQAFDNEKKAVATCSY